MKKLSIITIIVLIAGALLATTRAAASPLSVAAKQTGTPDAPGLQKTPGAKATEQAGKHGLHGKPTILHGTISAVDAGSVTLTLNDGTSQTIGLAPDTKIRVPGPQSAGDTLVVGMRAVVMAFTDPDTETLVARMVIAIPGQPVRAHRVGKVTQYTEGLSITIQATDGNTYTFGLAPDIKILPEDRAGDLAEGSLVTIIAPRVPSNPGWTAKGIVVHPTAQP